MPNREDALHELQRLQCALEALSADIDAIERRPHWLSRKDEEFRGIETFVDHFAFAVKAGNARL
jgi:hypothetical protein